MKVSGGIHITRKQSPKGIYLNGEHSSIHKLKNGALIPSSPFTIVGVGVEIDIYSFEFSVNGASYAPVLPSGVSLVGNIVYINPANITFNTLSIRASAEDTTYRAVFTITFTEDGKDGGSGTPGRGVKSVATWYYKSTSPTQQIGGAWTIVKPEYTNSTFLWTKEITTYTDDSATETSPIIDPDWHKIMAITDKFGVTQDGGLIQAVMMLLREFNSQQETAGLNGMQGALKNNPAFWAGGTYSQAFAFIQFLSKMSAGTTPGSGEYDGLAKIVLLHNGAAKVGDFIVEPSGRIVMVDPSTGKARLIFGVQDIPTVASLMAGTVSSGSASIGSGTTSGVKLILSGSTNVTQAGAMASFSGTTLSIYGNGQLQGNGMSSWASATLYAYRNGLNAMALASITINFTSPSSTYQYDTVDTIPTTSMIPAAGNYTFGIEVTIGGTVSSHNASCSASTFSWTHTLQGVNRQQYGRNGMMFYYSNNHFHFTEDGGLDMRGTMNIPGLLFSGSVLNNGGFASWWGAKKHSSLNAVRQGTGTYAVYHSVGHSNYQVAITPASNRTFYVGTKSSTYFIVYFYTNASSPSLSDTAFDFQMTGNNY